MCQQYQHYDTMYNSIRACVRVLVCVVWVWVLVTRCLRVAAAHCAPAFFFSRSSFRF